MLILEGESLTEENVERLLQDAEAKSKQRVAFARERIRKALDEYPEGLVHDTVASGLQSLAEAEGELWVYSQAADLAHMPGTTLRDVYRYAVYALSDNPDDTWSGRRNDTRRAFHDGKRSAAKELLPPSHWWRTEEVPS